MFFPQKRKFFKYLVTTFRSVCMFFLEKKWPLFSKEATTEDYYCKLRILQRVGDPESIRACYQAPQIILAVWDVHGFCFAVSELGGWAYVTVSLETCPQTQLSSYACVGMLWKAEKKSVWLQLNEGILPIGEEDFLGHYRRGRKKGMSAMLQCFSLETHSWLLPVATVCTQTDQDIKVAIIWLPPGCQPRLESQWVWHLCWNGSVSYSLQSPPSDLLSLHFRKQLFFHKLQSLGWQPTWQWQIAWGCSGTFPFIFAQSQHSLPGTTSVTRAATRAPRCQPCQLIRASCSSCSPVRAAVGMRTLLSGTAACKRPHPP